MTSRYDNREIGINAKQLYRRMFRDRGVGFVKQYFSPDLPHPSVEQIKNLSIIDHTWRQGDRYYKLAHKYYNDSTLWWVIAWYNQKPTEGHLELGDIVKVPLPLEKILRYFEE